MLLRWICYTLACFVALHGLATLGPQLPAAFGLLLTLVNYGRFVPLAAAVAAGMLNAKPVVPPLAILVALSAFPCTTEGLAHAVLPIGAGLVIGIGLRSLVQPTEAVPHE